MMTMLPDGMIGELSELSEIMLGTTTVHRTMIDAVTAMVLELAIA